MAQRDPYEVLGISRDASADEIKTSFRKLARQYHPDVNPGDPSAEEKFKEIGNAYSVLSDPEKKDKFDRYGVTDDQPSGADFMQGGGIGDLFDMFFGQSTGGGSRRGFDGESIGIEQKLTLGEVLTGIEKKVKYRRFEACSSCNGTGAEGGAQPEKCPNCKGSGSVSRIANTILGQMQTRTTCPNCRGTGRIVKNPCATCNGRRVEMKDAEETIQIPAGIESGQQLQLSGKGHTGLDGGRRGDLYVQFEVEEDARFHRDGQNLITELTVSFVQASLGDEVKIEGVDKEYDLTIARGTQPGQELKLRGAGLPSLRGTRRGDLIVMVQVEVPRHLNSDQEKAIRALADVFHESQPKHGSHSILGGLFGKK